MANALPQQWPGHCFSRSEVEAVLAKLREHQDPKAAPFVGERFALTMLDKTPAELKEILNKLDNEAGNELTDWLFAAQGSLKMRITLVRAAIAPARPHPGLIQSRRHSQAPRGAGAFWPIGRHLDALLADHFLTDFHLFGGMGECAAIILSGLRSAR